MHSINLNLGELDLDEIARIGNDNKYIISISMSSVSTLRRSLGYDFIGQSYNGFITGGRGYYFTNNEDELFEYLELLRAEDISFKINDYLNDIIKEYEKQIEYLRKKRNKENSKFEKLIGRLSLSSSKRKIN